MNAKPEEKDSYAKFYRNPYNLDCEKSNEKSILHPKGIQADVQFDGGLKLIFLR